MGRIEERLMLAVGSWWHFACFVAGMVGGYLLRPWLDQLAAAVRLWMEYQT